MTRVLFQDPHSLPPPWAVDHAVDLVEQPLVGPVGKQRAGKQVPKGLMMIPVISLQDLIDALPELVIDHRIGPHLPVYMSPAYRCAADHDLMGNEFSVGNGVSRQVRQVAISEGFAAIVASAFEHGEPGGPVVAKLLDPA